MERRQSMIDLHERVAALETLATEIKADVRDLVGCLKGNGQEGVLTKLDSRLKSVEGWRAWVNGIAAAIGALFTAVTAYFGLKE